MNKFVCKQARRENPRHRKNNCQEGVFKQANANFWFNPYVGVCAHEWNIFKMRELSMSVGEMITALTKKKKEEEETSKDEL